MEDEGMPNLKVQSAKKIHIFGHTLRSIEMWQSPGEPVRWVRWKVTAREDWSKWVAISPRALVAITELLEIEDVYGVLFANQAWRRALLG